MALSGNADGWNGEALFDLAMRQNFPPFLAPIELSTPVNATPFMVGYAKFCSVARRWPGRRRLVESLAHTIADARQYGAEIFALLIGGSFTDLQNPAPKDIDSILFYRRVASTIAIDAPGLRELQKRAKAANADVRFIPADGDPLILIKSVSFFTRLYSESRTQSRQTCSSARGLILVDCATTSIGSAKL